MTGKYERVNVKTWPDRRRILGVGQNGLMPKVSFHFSKNLLA